MIAVGDRVQAQGRFVTREGIGPSLGFWDAGQPWGADVVAPRQYPAVQLYPGKGQSLDHSELVGRHVEISGSWQGDGVVRVERVAVLETPAGPDRPDEGLVSSGVVEEPTPRPARVAAAEDRLFGSGDLIWRSIDPTESRASVIIRVGADSEDLVAAYRDEWPQLDVQVLESAWTADQLDRATAALGSLPESHLYAVGRGLRGSDVAVTASVLYRSAAVDAVLADFPEGLIEIEYLVHSDTSA